MKGFFAYPNDSRISDVVLGFSKAVNDQGMIDILPWENMNISGKLLVSEICHKISESDVFLADVTKLNPNVFFELGYAISKGKRIWLIRDETVDEHNVDFTKFRLLTNVGYRGYENSRDVINWFYKDLPHENLDDTIYEKLIEPNLRFFDPSQLFYLKPKYTDEACVQVDQFLSNISLRSRFKLIVDDPKESPFQPLEWYVKNILYSHALVCHLTAYNRIDSRIQNARHSFAAGVAHGFDIPVLLLVENDPIGPADYRDMLFSYKKASEALGRVEDFTRPFLEELNLTRERSRSAASQRRSEMELSKLDFGEPVAEHDSSETLDETFISNAAYEAGRSGKQAIFVGNKGVGKTANFLKLSAEFGKDKRVLVCEISPVSYEFEGVVEVAKKFENYSKRGYLFESLWKFLIYTEIAKVLERQIRSRPSNVIHSHEVRLIEMIDQNPEFFDVEFSGRLDNLSKQLNSVELNEGAIKSVSEWLHEGHVRNLSMFLAEALEKTTRVAVLVDNLDKAWENNSDSTYLTHFFLALLATVKKVSSELRARIEKSHRRMIDVTLCVFVRSDVFDLVLRVAGEPDKVQFQRLSWDDPEKLKHLADVRLRAALNANENVSTDDLWKRFFVELVDGVPLMEYMLSIILTKPRDLLVFLRAALTSAANRRSAKVEKEDFLKAEVSYSQFCYESLLVETRQLFPRIEDICSRLMGASAILSESEIFKLIDDDLFSEPESLLKALTLCSFFEMEVPNKGFVVPRDDREFTRLLQAARNIAAAKGRTPNFRVHRAFRDFLVIQNEDSVK